MQFISYLIIYSSTMQFRKSYLNNVFIFVGVDRVYV